MYAFVGKKEVGKRLTALRGDRPANTVARALSLTPSALANYEAGLRIPRDDVKARIANYYQVPIESIFFV